jgi:valyl-tRNA synthetase
VRKCFDEYNIHLAIKNLREFYYAEYCDFYIETTKPAFNSTSLSLKTKELIWNVLSNCNSYALTLYHPIIPSITEELWQRNKKRTKEDTISLNESILDSTYLTISELSEFEVLDELKLYCF